MGCAFFMVFLWLWWQLCYSSTYSLLHSVLRVSLVTPYRSSSDGVLTVLASPPFSIGSLLKQLCLDLTQPVFPRPQRTHKNTLAKSETTLQHAHECVCVSIQAPLHTWATLDSTWLCCGYAWTHKKHKYISMHIMHTYTYTIQLSRAQSSAHTHAPPLSVPVETRFELKVLLYSDFGGINGKKKSKLSLFFSC